VTVSARASSPDTCAWTSPAHGDLWLVACPAAVRYSTVLARRALRAPGACSSLTCSRSQHDHSHPLRAAAAASADRHVYLPGGQHHPRRPGAATRTLWRRDDAHHPPSKQHIRHRLQARPRGPHRRSFCENANTQHLFRPCRATTTPLVAFCAYARAERNTLEQEHQEQRKIAQVHAVCELGSGRADGRGRRGRRQGWIRQRQRGQRHEQALEKEERAAFLLHRLPTLQLELHQKRAFGETHSVRAAPVYQGLLLTLHSKHTGERPFQCHCSRRFSRLDNLRQHAQTVHVNEDIPAESLAATGTRFQRQIRTDRVRPPGSRSRANTLGSTGGHSRGHSRNLSTSSITATISGLSVAQSPDARRRPPPLAMASEGSARAHMSSNTMDAYNPPLMGSPGPQIVEHDTQSNAPTTPTSATYSTMAGSPARYGSTIQSPVSTSRPVSWAGPPPGRRLSNSNPFTGPPGQIPPPYMTPLQSSTSSTFSPQSSVYASPTVPHFPESRRDSNADADWRRRTWHPGTYMGPRPATSGLGYHQTPDSPQPSFTSQPAASQTRLPGIESFDYAPPPLPLPRRQPSPMHLDAPARPLTYHAPVDSNPGLRHEKRMSISWDTTLQRGINRLDLVGPNSPREQWSHYPASAGPVPAVRPMTAPHGYFNQRNPTHIPPPLQVSPVEAVRNSQDSPGTPRKNKRQAWYNGPVSQPARAVQRTSPEDSSSSEGVPTPGNTTMSEYHPAIVHSNGFVEAHPPGAHVEEHKPSSTMMDRPHPLHQGYQHYHRHSLSSSSSTYRPQREPERVSFGQPVSQARGGDMRRLEALVAVATGEQKVGGNGS
jgi:hypothetical protein